MHNNFIEETQETKDSSNSKRPSLFAPLFARLHPLTVVVLPPVLLVTTPILSFFVVFFTFKIAVYSSFGISSLLMNLLVPLLACVLAVAVSVLRNPMHALLALVGVFLSTVLFYIIVGAEFIGLVFLIVYVGAVAILFLFVIMLLNVKALTSLVQLVQFKTQKLAMFLGLGLLVRTFFVVLPGVEKALVLSHRAHLTRDDELIQYVNITTNDVNALTSLYTTHASLFILITLILLVALIGAIVLATTTLEEQEPVATHG